MKTIYRTILLGGVAACAANAAQAQQIAIDDVFGAIVWTESDSVSVTVENPGDLVETPKVSQRGDGYAVEGDRRKMRSYSCRSRRGGDLQIRVSRFGDYHSIEDFPVIRVSAPASASLKVTDSMVHGETGDLSSADVEMDGCGRLTLGDVSGDLRGKIDGSGDIETGDVGGDAVLKISGSGDLATGSIAGSGKFTISGSGDIETGAVANGGDLSIDGSGGIYVDRIDGPLEASVNGSGDIEVDGGETTSFKVTIAGSGDVSFDGAVTNPEIAIMGSGDVWVASYSGKVDKRIMGSGDFSGDCAGSCS